MTTARKSKAWERGYNYTLLHLRYYYYAVLYYYTYQIHLREMQQQQVYSRLQTTETLCIKGALSARERISLLVGEVPPNRVQNGG